MAVIKVAEARLPKTIDDRRMGAASSSRSAPCWRSMRTPRPENMQLRGISSPAVATQKNVM
jgi:hypothetical protein